MLTIEKTVLPSPEQWEIIIEGMRNPKNSWDRIDSVIDYEYEILILGKNDHDLMTTLADGGPVHAKYRRMIPVYVTINAPLYWWKEFDTHTRWVRSVIPVLRCTKSIAKSLRWTISAPSIWMMTV